MDVRSAGESPCQGEPSAEQVAAIRALVAAVGFQATVEAQERLLAQLLPALAAREELLGRGVSRRTAGGASAAPTGGAHVSIGAAGVTVAPVGVAPVSVAQVSVAQVSVAELQAALRAAWAGQFRTDSWAAEAPTRPPEGRPGWALSGRVVMVVGCHGGAGASTVALAMALAAGESGRSVRLLDCASAERSGLLTAVDAELGVEPSGWRRGRHARLPIDRVAGVLASAADLPAPPDELPGQAEVTVVDSGWGATGVLSGGSWLTQAAESAAVVLVARATVPALRQLEQVLAICHQDPLVAMRGPSRWDRSVSATSGPLLLAAKASGRVVSVPSNRHLALVGITYAPLPKAVLEAGRQIFAHVLAAHPQAPTAQDRPDPR